MRTVEEIIDLLGGPKRVSELLRVSRGALRKWRQFGAVPARHQLALIRASGGALSVDDFAEAAPAPMEDAA